VCIYFALVFGFGFLLGPPRVLWLAPHVGPRAAELLEAPLMLAAILLAGRWVSQRFCRGYPAWRRLSVGMIAAAAVLAADISVGVLLRGMPLAQVFIDRDPVSGIVYYGLVTVFALAPWLLGGSSRHPPG
jgi:hypothetical protein